MTDARETAWIVSSAFRSLATAMSAEAEKSRKAAMAKDAGFGGMLIAAEYGALLKMAQHVANVASNFERLASADTHPKDGDAQQAPLVSGAVAKPDAQTEPS